MVQDLFDKIDTDSSKSIDKAETLKYWSANFAKLNTIELFDQVDKNNDGTIQLEEWIEFWTEVYRSGHTEEEIEFEVGSFYLFFFVVGKLIERRILGEIRKCWLRTRWKNTTQERRKTLTCSVQDFL